MSFENFFREQMEDPEVRAAYESVLAGEPQFTAVGIVGGRDEVVTHLGGGPAGGAVTARPHVFSLIEAALEKRGLPLDTLYDDPETLLTVLIADVFEPVATVNRGGLMETHSFTLRIEGDVEAALDALYEAGCDDALFGSVDGVWHADFDREAPSFEDAVSSAVSDVESVNVIRVVGVTLDDGTVWEDWQR